MTQEALKLALDALIWTTGSGDFGEGGYAHEGAKKCLFPAITAIKEALAQTQEPVAWRAPKWSNLHNEYGYRDFNDPLTGIDGKASPNNEPLYLHPPQRTWVGLTEQQRNDIEDVCEMIIGKPAFDAIEAKLKEKNT